MAGSDISDGSAQSNASSYHSVVITEEGLQQSDLPVPENAPELIDGAEGFYDQQSDRYFADTHRGVAQWSQSRSKWTLEGLDRAAQAAAGWIAANRHRLAQFARDTLPTLAMGTAPLVDGRAGQVLTYGGNLGQVATVAKEVWDEYREHRAGAQSDPWQRAAIGFRTVSVVANTTSNFGNFSNPSVTNAFNGVGTYAGALGTGIDIIHHGAHHQREQQDPGAEMYGWHHNPVLGTDWGQIPPWHGPSVPDSASPASRSAQGSSTSVQPQPPIATPAPAFYPPSSSSGRRPPRSTGDRTASTSEAAANQRRRGRLQ